MSFFKSLADLQKATEVQEYSGDLEKIPYLTVKDKEKFLIRFRQELVLDAPGYDEEVGVAKVVALHSNPADFRKTSECTATEEYNYKCWACEQVARDSKWRAKNHLVINVAVFDADSKEWTPAILDQKFTSAHIGQNIVDMAVEYGTLLTHDYKISRTGTGQKTQYNLLPVGEKDADASIADLPLRDLSNLRKVYSYAEQPGFYLGEEDKGSAEGWGD